LGEGFTQSGAHLEDVTFRGLGRPKGKNEIMLSTLNSASINQMRERW